MDYNNNNWQQKPGEANPVNYEHVETDTEKAVKSYRETYGGNYETMPHLNAQSQAPQQPVQPQPQVQQQVQPQPQQYQNQYQQVPPRNMSGNLKKDFFKYQVPGYQKAFIITSSILNIIFASFFMLIAGLAVFAVSFTGTDLETTAAIVLVMIFASAFLALSIVQLVAKSRVCCIIMLLVYLLFLIGNIMDIADYSYYGYYPPEDMVLLVVFVILFVFQLVAMICAFMAQGAYSKYKRNNRVL